MMSTALESDLRQWVVQTRQLGGQAHQLANQEDLAGALELARQAVAQWRVIAAEDPQFIPELARGLGRLTMYLSRARIHEEGFAAATECVNLWRQSAADDLNGFGPELADALRRLAPFALKVHWREYLLVREEAMHLMIRLAASDPALLPAAAESASQVTVQFSKSGQPKKALQYGRQAVELWRILAEKDLVRFGAGLVKALQQLATERTSPEGRTDGALRREARQIAVHRTLRVVWQSLHPGAVGAVVATARTMLRASEPASRHES